MEHTRFVVSGATGRVGSALLRTLTSKGLSVRALTRTPTHQPVLPGVAWTYADLTVPASLPPALEGAEGLFVLTSATDGMVEAQENLIKAGVDAGVRHIVKQSALGASDHTKSTIARWHYEVEGYLQATGVPWTMLRPHYFMDNLLGDADGVRSTGEVRSPLGSARVPFIDSADIGAVAAEVLASSGFQGEKLVLTGAATLSYGDVARQMSEVFGRRVRYREESMDEARARLASPGAPPWEVESMTALWGYQRAEGPTARVSPDVARVLGREPRTLREFLVEHRSVFLGT